MKTNTSYTDLNKFKRNPFLVPEDYFAQLEKDVLAQTSGETMIPASFSRKHPFLVDEVYFETLGSDIENKIKTPAKTVSMRPLYWSAAAAMLVGTIFWFQPRQAENVNAISHNDIAEYLAEDEEYPFADDAIAIVSPNTNNTYLYTEVTNTVAADELNDLSE